MKKKIRSSYQLYKKFLADILFISGLFILTILANYIPYINILVANFNPVLTGAVVVWFASYIIFRPEIRAVLVGALAILAFTFIFIILGLDIAVEVLGSLVFAMMVTVLIVEMRQYKKR